MIDIKSKLSDRLNNVPPYPFASFAEKKARVSEFLKSKGIETIIYDIGDHDAGTPSHIVDAASKAIQDPVNHHYPGYMGLEPLRFKIAEWYKDFHGVEINPKTEVIVLGGAKEGIAHFSQAILNKGDRAIITDPGYPAYRGAIALCEAEAEAVPITAENEYLPDLDHLYKLSSQPNSPKMAFLNYPNNPTTATGNSEYFQDLGEFFRKTDTICAFDFCYGDMYDDARSEPPISFLSFADNKDLAIQFHSFSKTFRMCGWRIGFAVGSPDLIAALAKIKQQVDSGVFQAVQLAALKAMSDSDKCLHIEETNKIIARRRAEMEKGFEEIGIRVIGPPQNATFYMWLPIPASFKTSLEFVMFIFERTGVLFTPGTFFGEGGEGFFRVALISDKIHETFERIRKCCGNFKWCNVI